MLGQACHMVTLFVKGQLNHMVKILVEFLFAAAAKTVEAFAGGGHRRAVEQHAAVHGGARWQRPQCSRPHGPLEQEEKLVA